MTTQLQFIEPYGKDNQQRFMHKIQLRSLSIRTSWFHQTWFIPQWNLKHGHGNTTL